MTTQIKPDVRLVTEGSSFTIAALIRDYARVNSAGVILEQWSAIHQTNTATRFDTTSHFFFAEYAAAIQCR